MTLDLQTSRVVFKGNGVAVEFPFDFKVWDASQIAVFVSDDPDGINEMEVTPQKVILTESGGTVTYTLEGKPLPEGYTLSIVRNMPFIQEDMYITGTRFNPEVIETRFDKDCAERQQILETLSRCIKVSVTSDMTPEQLLKAIFKAYHDILESLASTGSITGAIPVVATGTTEPRPLKDRFADIINVKDFGAKGDGMTDDTEAWNKWKAVSNGIKYVPSGKYLVDGSIRHFPVGCIGNVDAESFDVSRWNQNVKAGNVLNIGRGWTPSNLEDCENIAPVIAIENKIDASNVSGYENRAVCAYLTHTQEGDNPDNELFSTTLIVSAVNNAAGDNDVIGSSNRVIKYNVPGGVGDAAGTGGRLDLYSTQKGAHMGAEFAVHIVKSDGQTRGHGIPRPSDFSNAPTSKWCAPVHILADSSSISDEEGGSPASCGIYMQGRRDKNSFWNGIVMTYSMFSFEPNKKVFINEIPNIDGTENPSYPGEYVTADEKGHCDGTVAINMGSFSENNGYPEIGIRFGYCTDHIHTPNDGLRVRTKSVDIHSAAHVGIRIRADKTDEGIYGNKYVSFYDGDTHLGGVEYFGGALRIVNTNASSGVALYSSAFRPLLDDKLSLGNSRIRFKQVYATSGSISTSDERKKQSISDIPDDVLDAWGEVHFSEFKFNAAVEQKGDSARFHTGLIAQKIKEIFEKHNIDPFKYGLLCYDKWDGHPDIYNEYDETIPAVYDEEGKTVSGLRIVHHKELVEKAVDAGDLYSIRYEEALCLEAAYQRRRADRIEARLAALEKKLGSV